MEETTILVEETTVSKGLTAEGKELGDNIETFGDLILLFINFFKKLFADLFG